MALQVRVSGVRKVVLECNSSERILRTVLVRVPIGLSVFGE